MFSFSGMACPVCATSLGRRKTCKTCGFVVETSNGIVDLRSDKSFDTLLDIEKYVEAQSAHTRNTGLGVAFKKIMRGKGRPKGGHVLELAAGSGNLTLQLLGSDEFDTYSASDISPEFLEVLSRRHKENPSKTPLRKFLFDANRLPFTDGQFDFIVGNSVLHHFARFEETLKECARVLRPGGVAVFGEPIIDTHAYISLAAGIIFRRIDADPEWQVDPKSNRALQHLKEKTSKKIDNLNSSRDDLSKIEDKFQFPVAYLRALTEKLGFSEFHLYHQAIGDLGAVVRDSISSLLLQHGGNADILREFDYIFDAFRDDYGAPMGQYLSAKFNLFYYVKDRKHLSLRSLNLSGA